MGQKKNFFFALKSFLNDFKAILRKKIFFDFFTWEKFAFENLKKIHVFLRFFAFLKIFSLFFFIIICYSIYFNQCVKVHYVFVECALISIYHTFSGNFVAHIDFCDIFVSTSDISLL